MYKLKYSYKSIDNITEVTITNDEGLFQMLDFLINCPNVLTIDLKVKRLKEKE